MIENIENNTSLVAGIEAILFISGSPVLISHLDETFNVATREIENALDELIPYLDKYQF